MKLFTLPKEERSDSNDNLQRSGTLQNTEPKSETKEIQHRQIWSNEIGLSEEREESVIRANENQGYTSRTPIGDRFNGNEESKFDIERDDDEGTNNRGIEREKSNEVDRVDEQFEESSRRNSNERVDSKLDENTNNSILFSFIRKVLFKS